MCDTGKPDQDEMAQAAQGKDRIAMFPLKPYRSADHEHRPVGQVNHLVRGAAQDQPGQVAAAPRAHDDHADVEVLGVLDDLAGGSGRSA